MIWPMKEMQTTTSALTCDQGLWKMQLSMMYPPGQVTLGLQPESRL